MTMQASQPLTLSSNMYTDLKVFPGLEHGFAVKQQGHLQCPLALSSGWFALTSDSSCVATFKCVLFGRI